MTTLNHAPPRTPPRSRVETKTSIPQATPRLSRSTGDGSVITSDRKDMAREMDTEMLVCDIETFQRSYLPFIPSEGDITACAQMLSNAGILISGGDESLQWRDFPNSPSKLKDPEKRVFSALTKIADALVSHTLSLNDVQGAYSKPRLRYRDGPEARVASELEGANFKMDGCFELADESTLSSCSPDLITADIVVVAEYKKHEVDTLDNRFKVISAASHIMNDDPRRIFTFGITIEDTMMSLWYFSRSHSTKSNAFNFIQNPRLLISVFLSFLFGDKTSLGYDPAVRRHNRNRVYYEYEISEQGRSRYYRTIGSLSSYRSLGITGRMTRVWRAMEISEFNGSILSGKEVALKDVWLQKDARTERDIQRRIFQAVEAEKAAYNDGSEQSRLHLINSWPDTMRKNILKSILEGSYRDYFMTIECDQEGSETKDKPPDAIPRTGLFSPGEGKNAGYRSRQVRGSDSSRNRGTPVRSSKRTAASSNKPREDRRYLRRKRYLLVFTDVGQALHDVTEFRTSFEALRDVALALAILFIANWVHRDISTGNVIVIRGDKTRGKLSDLEYAKEFASASPTSTDPKTGTPFFMAFELLSQSLIYDDQSDEPEEPKAYSQAIDAIFSSDISNIKKGPAPSIMDISDSAKSPVAIMYNFQYDLESLWWIVLWILLARVDWAPAQDYARTIFINELDNSKERRLAFTQKGRLVSQLQQVLHPDLHPFIKFVEQSRTELRSSYISRERNDRVLDPTSYLDIYYRMTAFLGLCLLESLEDLPTLIHLHPRQATKSTRSSAKSPAIISSSESSAANSSKRSLSPSANEDENKSRGASISKKPRVADQDQPLHPERPSHSSSCMTYSRLNDTVTIDSKVYPV